MSSHCTIPEKLDGAFPDRLGLRLWLRLLTCTMAVEKRMRQGLASTFDTTLPRFDVLSALERRPTGMTMGDLSRALLVSNGNVTGIVRALVADGLVISEPVATDRRACRVRLSRKGQSRFHAMAAAHHQWVEGLLADLNVDERNDLYRNLGRLKASIAAADGMRSQ